MLFFLFRVLLYLGAGVLLASLVRLVSQGRELTTIGSRFLFVIGWPVLIFWVVIKPIIRFTKNG